MSGSKATGATTALRKRSVVLHGHATSVALEPAFWDALQRWAEEEGMSVASLVASIDKSRNGGSLASAIRVAVLRYAFARHPEG